MTINVTIDELKSFQIAKPAKSCRTCNVLNLSMPHIILNTTTQQHDLTIEQILHAFNTGQPFHLLSSRTTTKHDLPSGTSITIIHQGKTINTTIP